ncbi:hypothetical protein BJ085DRAFT_27902 [Dimargaris cristalligena]|uniref:Uncharacterized protein n=1 Tax=Dimargaris cristalligena TaxID=215637 RepID=A0A4Q0A1K9_9FUNG|nr:hypothetical protein BJ085DRAFT_27902 [Dimargaris cristalligena]|eukprot:RKP39934.1 hypothetical protein BJ085DRAFT_27902 [Dimargaris cristalligena]
MDSDESSPPIVSITSDSPSLLRLPSHRTPGKRAIPYSAAPASKRSRPQPWGSPPIPRFSLGLSPRTTTATSRLLPASTFSQSNSRVGDRPPPPTFGSNRAVGSLSPATPSRQPIGANASSGSATRQPAGYPKDDFSHWVKGLRERVNEALLARPSPPTPIQPIDLPRTTTPPTLNSSHRILSPTPSTPTKPLKRPDLSPSPTHSDTPSRRLSLSKTPKLVILDENSDQTSLSRQSEDDEVESEAESDDMEAAAIDLDSYSDGVEPDEVDGLTSYIIKQNDTANQDVESTIDLSDSDEEDVASYSSSASAASTHSVAFNVITESEESDSPLSATDVPNSPIFDTWSTTKREVLTQGASDSYDSESSELSEQLEGPWSLRLLPNESSLTAPETITTNHGDQVAATAFLQSATFVTQETIDSCESSSIVESIIMGTAWPAPTPDARKEEKHCSALLDPSPSGTLNRRLSMESTVSTSSLISCHCSPAPPSHTSASKESGNSPYFLRSRCRSKFCSHRSFPNGTAGETSLGQMNSTPSTSHDFLSPTPNDVALLKSPWSRKPPRSPRKPNHYSHTNGNARSTGDGAVEYQHPADLGDQQPLPIDTASGTSAETGVGPPASNTRLQQRRRSISPVSPLNYKVMGQSISPTTINTGYSPQGTSPQRSPPLHCGQTNIPAG